MESTRDGTVLVEARVVGRREVAEQRELRWPDAPARTTAAALVEHVVRAEVSAFAERQRENRLLRVLTEAQIADSAVAGKVAAEVRPATAPPDADASVRVALEAFADGLFLLFVDDHEVQDPAATIELRPDLRVRFVRMTPLAGGA